MSQESARRRPYLEDRRNFTRVTTAAFAVLYGVLLLWMFGGYGGVEWWLVIALIAFAVARLWAFVMWFVFRGVYSVGEQESDEAEGTQPSPDHRSR
jgi:fatty acid desaturase